MSAKSKKQSPALALVWLVWEHCRMQSWQHINSAMGDALRLAITANLRFEAGDIHEIVRSCRAQYWMNSESQFASAVERRNTSACQSFEACFGRGPFIWNSYRIAVGSDLIWDGVLCKVTSFGKGSDDPKVDSIIACSYKSGGYPTKIDRRFTVTRHALRAAEKARKAANLEPKADEAAEVSL